MIDQVVSFAMEKYAGDFTLAKEFVDGFVKAANSEGRDFGSEDPRTSFFKDRNGHKKISDEEQIRLESTVYGKKRGGHTGLSMADTFLNGFSGNVGSHLGSLAIALGATAVGNAYTVATNMNLHSKFLQALYKAVEGNRLLKESSKERVLQYAETVFKFAPNVATDPNLLSSILANAIHGEGIDPMTIKTLTELEGRFKDNTSFSPKTYV